MKELKLKQIIKEEIQKVLKESLETSLENNGFEVYPEKAWIVRNPKNGVDFIVFTEGGEGGEYRSIELAENLPGSTLGEDIEDFIEQFMELN
jgi:hypothetical protein